MNFDLAAPAVGVRRTLGFAMFILAALAIACHVLTSRAPERTEPERRADVERAWSAHATYTTLRRFVPTTKALDTMVSQLDRLDLGIEAPIGPGPVAGVYGDGGFILTLSTPEPGRFVGAIDSIQVLPRHHVADFEGQWISTFATADVDAPAVGKPHVALSMRVGSDPTLVLSQAHYVLPREPDSDLSITMSSSFFSRARGPVVSPGPGVDPVVRQATRRATRAATTTLDRGLADRAEDLDRARAAYLFYAERAHQAPLEPESTTESDDERRALLLAAIALAVCAAVVGAASAKLNVGHRSAPAAAVTSVALALVLLLHLPTDARHDAAVERARAFHEDSVKARANVAVTTSELDATRAATPFPKAIEHLEEKLVPIETRARNSTLAAVPPGIYFRRLAESAMGSYLSVRATGVDTVEVIEHAMPQNGQASIAERLQGTVHGADLDLVGTDAAGRRLHETASLRRDVLTIHDCKERSDPSVWYPDGACNFVLERDDAVATVVAKRPSALDRALRAIREHVVNRGRRLVPDGNEEPRLANELTVAKARWSNRKALSEAARESIEAASDDRERLDALRWIGEFALAIAAVVSLHPRRRRTS